MRAFGIVGSMKDFYWDIRPKPEFGTIEIRVCDTPLTVERAAMLAAYAQLLCRYLLHERECRLSEEMYYVYNYNRFQACRFGLGGELIDPWSHNRSPIAEDILNTLPLLAPHAKELDVATVTSLIHKIVYSRASDSAWMRERYSISRSLEELVWQQALLWRGELQR
jgi:carboxylate-amine ligase